MRLVDTVLHVIDTTSELPDSEQYALPNGAHCFLSGDNVGAYTSEVFGDEKIVSVIVVDADDKPQHGVVMKFLADNPNELVYSRLVYPDNLSTMKDYILDYFLDEVCIEEIF